MPPFRPCILQLEERFPKQHADMAPQLERAAALGLDHVMLGQAGHLDVACLEAGLALARTSNLSALVPVSLDRPSAGSPLSAAHAEWLEDRTDTAGLPDPRYPGSVRPSPPIRFDSTEVCALLRDWWVNELTRALNRGVNGFCIDLGGPAPASFIGELIRTVKASAPSVSFLASMPGATHERMLTLRDCGFDAVLSSAAWWDFRSPWLQEEARLLQDFGEVIATTGPAARGSTGEPASEAIELARRERCLWLAAMTGDGLMISDDSLAAMFTLAAADGDAAVSRQSALVERAISTCKAKTSRSLVPAGSCRWRVLSVPEAPVTVIQAAQGPVSSTNNDSWLLVANASPDDVLVDAASVLARFDGLGVAGSVWPDEPLDHLDRLRLKTAECRVYKARVPQPAGGPVTDKRAAATAARTAARAARIAIEKICPSVDNGRFVARCVVGTRLAVEADVFGEGHDRLTGCVRWRAIDAEADETGWQEIPLRQLGNDRWRADLPLTRVGRHEYHVEAWIDVFGAYRDEIEKKTRAGQQVDLELKEGRLLLEAALARTVELNSRTQVRKFQAALKTFDKTRSHDDRVAFMLSSELHAVMMEADPRAFKTSSATLRVDVERRAAGFSSWYELFPRSMGRDACTHGTLLDVMARLPAIEAMGFDTLYFTPIHPIGRIHRKGPGNSLEAGEEDVGSPYAIGSAEGGHDAIHPDLGTLEDFRTLRNAAHSHGLELALDFAIQCSPDHPWLNEHPDWFTWRPDGTIRYAENPPKKYQDIVNVDFYAAGAVPKLWLALRDVVLFWVREGVKVFRVDNPHTKPMPFWEWMLGDVRARFPDVIFLAEAFTRPKPMYRLAKLGFSQSYSYFTWRHSKREFIDYLTELSQGEPRDFFRPHFFVNTPDINPYFLQSSGRAGFVIRAALAATLSGLWGLYSGFELCEAAPVPGKEEYLDSEKYELRHRDWAQPGNIVREVTLLNRLRQQNPALQSHLGVRFCNSSGDEILCFTKTAPEIEGAGSNVLVVAICMDPHGAHECDLEIPLEDWGLPEDACISAVDLVHGHRFTLRGRHHQLRLDPNELAFSVWRIDVGLGGSANGLE